MNSVIKLFTPLAFCLGLLFLQVQPAASHCQIPCGIYDDHAEVKAMLQDAETVEKSVRLINELAGKTDVQSQNQMDLT